MTSVRKRKMNRSSIKKNTRRSNNKKRINIHSNPVIAANWDHNLTLRQNYKKLGLRVKLGRSAGGVESEAKRYQEIAEENSQRSNHISPENIAETEDPELIPEGEARIIRDDKGEVERIIYGKLKLSKENKENNYESERKSESIIHQLEEHALKVGKEQKPRAPSDRETEVLQALYEKYGDDYERMKWDKKLNPYQQSPGDLRKRIRKWKRANIID